MLGFGNRSRQDSNQPPFPVKQMFILALCRICEPIAFMSIFPYVYYMIESFHITSNDRHIAMYAGMVTSAFAFAEFCSGVPWGRASDKFGRKPILLTGLAGTGLSMIMFGFSTNLPMALIARALGGLLNGNIGVLQTTVAEVVTVEAHQARAYSIMPVVWCLGSIVGSALGGALADPVRNYGWVQGTIWDKFPFLLPNLVCTVFVVIGLTVGILFLEETHEDKKNNKDYGLEMGKAILARFVEIPEENLMCQKEPYTEETLTLMHEDDFPPDYRSTASSPELSPTYAPAGLPPPAYQSIEGSARSSLDIDATAPLLSLEDVEAVDQVAEADKKDVSFESAFTKQVVLLIISYGILAYHTISAEQLLPVLFSMPESETPPSLPFKFLGGFGLPTKSIGGILSVQGLIQVITMIFVFPALNRRLGSLRLFRYTMFSYPLLYLIVPYLTLAPPSWRYPCVYMILVWKVAAQSFTFPSTMIMIANSSPSRRVLGTLNGTAASSASLCRAFGPTVSGLLQSAGLSLGVLGLPWWTNAVVAVAGVSLSIFMVEEKRRIFDNEKRPVEARDLAEAITGDDVNVVLAATDSPNASLGGIPSTPSSPIMTRGNRRDSKA